jgi:hypothetical protein
LEPVTWNDIRDIAIVPVANDLIADYSELSWLDGWDAKVKTAYETHRAYMRSRMKKPKDGEEIRIDRHKVASALAKGILDVRPLDVRVERTRNPSDGARLANEILAFEAALSIVTSFGIKEAEDQGNHLLKKAYEVDFILPESSDGPYEEHMHFGLRHASYVKQGQFDEFLFANLLFVLEAFHLSKATAHLEMMEVA